jgi:hypothetical protein
VATQGDSAQITSREAHPGTEAIRIGSDYMNFLHYQALRTVLRRALTEAVGYQLSKDWTQTVIIEMDDQGSAQNARAESWHYPTLTQEQIENLLIEPLAKHHAILVLHVCPGFVDQKLHAIVPAFQQVFTDEFGTRQDYVSTKRGIDEGLKRGVFEVQSHGWTHIATCPLLVTTLTFAPPLPYSPPDMSDWTLNSWIASGGGLTARKLKKYSLF